mmetsp:Transcript_863/g.1548  ORF Transcript_863/g.1548 Transcript_863/m.1548 type:complete len:602 (+) Transcript_863:64-1869(+)
MSPAEQKEFQSDIRVVDWKQYIKNAIIGNAVHLLQEDQIAPEFNFEQILIKEKSLLDSPAIYASKGKAVGQKDSSKYEAAVNDLARYRTFVSEEKVSPNKLARVNKSIQAELQRLRSKVSRQNCQFNFYTMTKVFDHLIDGLHINRANLDRLGANDPATRYVFMPVFKSMLDPLIHFYACFKADLDIGFTLGCFDQGLKSQYIKKRMNNLGVLSMRNDCKSPAETQTFEYVYQSLLEEIVADNKFTTLFQNLQIQRLGKYASQSLPDQSIKMLINAQEFLKSKHLRVKIVPVSISYERQIEDSIFTDQQVMGGPIVKDGLNQIIDKVSKLQAKKLGKVVVKYLEPISLRDYVKLNSVSEDPQNFLVARELTNTLYKQQQLEQEILMNGLVSTAFFMFQNQQSITFGQLSQEATTLYDLLDMKNIRKLINNPPLMRDLVNSLSQMGYSFQGNPMDKRTGKDAIIFRKAETPMTANVFCRQQNIIAAHFFHETVLANAINSANAGNSLAVASVKEVARNFRVLLEIFSNEFIAKQKNIKNYDFQSILQHECMMGTYSLSADGETIMVTNQSKYQSVHEFYSTILGQLIEPYLIVGYATHQLIR